MASKGLPQPGCAGRAESAARRRGHFAGSFFNGGMSVAASILAIVSRTHFAAE